MELFPQCAGYSEVTSQRPSQLYKPIKRVDSVLCGSSNGDTASQNLLSEKNREHLPSWRNHETWCDSGTLN